MDTAGAGREERGGRMETVTWKHTLPYVKQIADGNVLYDSGNSNRGSVKPRGVGWGGKSVRGSSGRGHR